MFNKGMFSFLAEFIEHSSQSWSCSSIDDSFCRRSSVSPFFKHINKTNNCDWVDDSWSFWFDWDILINNPAVCYIGNSKLTPCTLRSIERNLFTNKTFPLSTTCFNNFSITLQTSNEVWLCSPVSTLNCNPVRWVYRRSNNFD